jgi:hypothetical protein
LIIVASLYDDTIPKLYGPRPLHRQFMVHCRVLKKPVRALFGTLKGLDAFCMRKGQTDSEELTRAGFHPENGN